MDSPKVLLVEDDRFISIAYMDGLKRAGFKMINAKDGNEALAKAKSEKPDIILLDIIMPEKNGFEVLADLKADDELKKIPVMVMSNLGQDTDVSKAKQLGAADYLIKANYTVAEVVKKINFCLFLKK